MNKRVVCAFLLLAALSVMAFAQSRDTGAITGRVTDDQKSPLPGVNIALSSPVLMGQRATQTDAQGAFRFPALPPGEYSLKAVLQGFKSVTQDNIRVTTTVSLVIDIVLPQAAVAEEITVVGKSPTVDVKSTETASVTLSSEILRNIPYSQFTSDIVNMAPGVNNNVAFGASQNTGVAYTIDGVNVADPEAGSAWVFLDHNIIEEAKIMGVGLPAEYGNFTGVIFNLVTKTGGNRFSGHTEFDYQGSTNKKGILKSLDGAFWQANNMGAYTADFPDMTAPKLKLFDASAHLGGPITKDKLWFYTGVQWYETYTYPTGFPEASDYIQPRWFGKLTAAPSNTLTATLSLEVDTYNGTNRGANSTTSPEATVTQKSPEVVGNFSLTQILSPKTFFDLKLSYFWGYYYLDPETGMDAVPHVDLANNGWLTGASTYFFYADRTRLQSNASMTHYAEDFITGNHDFKFGVEVERSAVRNRFGYPGPNHMVYFDYYGPYLAYQYEGYDTKTKYTRFEAFAQDAWQITDRLNVSAGLRFSQNWGDVQEKGVVYKSTRLAPRLGLTFDILGDKSTIFKAHYGQFTEAMLSSYHDRMNPDSAYKDYISYEWNGTAWEEFDRTVHQSLYQISSDMHHPYMDQFTVAVERELFKDTSIGVSYIYRDWKNIIGYYDKLATYVPVQVTVPNNGQTYTVYERTSGSAHEYVLTNIKESDPNVMGKPYRRYSGFEVIFNKRFSDRWQVLASYVYGKAWGTMDNGFADDIGYNSRNSLVPGDPNFWINADGRSTFDPTHQVKIQATYIIPWIEVAFNAYLHAVQGTAWTTTYTTARLAQGRVTFFVEPRGSHHYDISNILDLRLEKIFTFSGRYRVGVIFDIFNVFNDDTITGWGTGWGSGASYYDASVYPSTDGHYLNSISRPRQARLGIRLIF